MAAPTLALRFGDITSASADVLVSSDDAYLSMSGGVSAAIRRAAGEAILLEVAKRIPAKLGDVVVTGAGALRAKHVFRAVTIGDGAADPNEVVAATTRKSLVLLRALGLSSIAFPAIGAGAAGFSYQDVAVHMASVIVDELRESREPVQVAIYLFDRFGQMQPIDYVHFFEQFAAHTHDVNEIAGRPPHIRTDPRDKQTAAGARRTGVLSELTDLDRERQSLEGRLAQYRGVLPPDEARRIKARLTAIQAERVDLLAAANPKPSNAVSVFVSYSHADETLRKELGKHLSVLERQGMIATWHDRMIGAGMEWAGAIDERLEDARIILLLISADSIDSRYCYDVEMTRALERHDSRQALGHSDHPACRQSERHAVCQVAGPPEGCKAGRDVAGSGLGVRRHHRRSSECCRRSRRSGTARSSVTQSGTPCRT